jgi:TrmH family RNA methyltransferase
MAEPLHITSRQNPRVKDAARLRDARERQRSGRFIIDGAREIVRAIESGVRPVEAFVCDELCTSADSRQAEAAVRRSNPEVFSVSNEVYEKLAFGERREGVIVVAERLERGLGDVRLPANAVVAVLEGVEKPGNVGPVLRSADAAGVDAVIVADGRTDLYNPNTIRASLGTVFRANVCEATTAEAIAWLRAQGLAIVAARPDAAKLYTEFDFGAGAAMVLGSEAAGLSAAWQSADITPVRLPMRGIADSLNVSTTAAVLFYEALRQRN